MFNLVGAQYDFPWFHGHQFVHGEFQLRCLCLHHNGVLVPVEFGTCSVIAHVMEGGGSNEAKLIVHTHGRLHVKGMTSRQSHQTTIAGNPLIRGSDEARVRLA
eukprot:scaffold9027_cov61-Attheya_sp.AAC.12